MGKTREMGAPVHRGPKNSAGRPSWLFLTLFTVGVGWGILTGGGATRKPPPPPSVGFTSACWLAVVPSPILQVLLW